MSVQRAGIGEHQLSCSLQCWHPAVWAVVQVPVASLLIQLPTNVPGKVANVGPGS